MLRIYYSRQDIYMCVYNIPNVYVLFGTWPGVEIGDMKER